MSRDQRTVLWIVLGVLLTSLLCCAAGGLIWSLRDRIGEVSEEETLDLVVLYSPEKEAWFAERVQAFNAQRIEVAGQVVQVYAEAMDSGAALEAILAGERYPTVWSPASTMWVPLLNQRWQEKSGSTEPLAVYPEPLVVSPLVIAMWQDHAQAMGYPSQELGWQEIIAATLDPRGWGAFGHAEWGSFKLGHTNPYFSNSGLLSVAAESYAGAGKVRDLTPEDLARPETRRYVQEIEQAIIHYGESSEYFAQQMAQRGPAYASAVVLEEHTVVRLNGGYYGSLPQPLVAIYPREGTFWSDHPYVVLRGDWISAQETAAALALRDFMLSRESQEKALEVGFRPANTTIPLENSIIRADMGVDPFQPQTVLEVPSAETTEALLETWLEVRKRVNLLLVVDISGSMEGEKLVAVQDGLKLFLEQMTDDDHVGILTFNDRVETLTPLTPLGPKRDQVESEINFLQAEYKTVLYDVSLEAVEVIRQAYDPGRINAIVLMSDGLDTASRHSKGQLLRELQQTAAAEQTVRIFTISYGDDADRALLQEIAQATQARMVEGTPENIRRIYVILSSYF
ncbi:MAG: VWA domain-containing protein [Chloroflexia bacterium]|nr:VWA domain-containing protein [Chloroflexia bacterium]